MFLTLPKSWDFLELHVENAFRHLETALDGVPDGLLCPPAPLILRALEDLAPSDVRVVWVGQDPYPRVADAIGRSFAVPAGRPVSASLTNLDRELQANMGVRIGCWDLQHWVDQGFLLLNTHLTTLQGTPLAHDRLGWEQVTGKIVQQMAGRYSGLVFVGLGKHAQRFIRKWTEGHETDHHFVFAAHPSPAAQGGGDPFLGSKIYTRISAALSDEGHRPMLWGADQWKLYQGLP